MQVSTSALGVGPSDVSLSWGLGWYYHCHSKNPEKTQFSLKQDSGWKSNSTKCLLGNDLSPNLHTLLNGRAWQIPKFPVRRRIFIAHSTLKNNKSTMNRTTEDELENLDVLNVDPSLASHKAHLKYRHTKFLQQKRAIEKYEGSLEDFSQGYLKYGFNREENKIVYQEWAPAAKEAQLIGDFNAWNGSGHQMEKDQFGVWTVYIPDKDGKPAIPHGSKVKFRMKVANGTWVDRIPAWIRYATVDPSSFGAAYDGIYWDPPPSKRYEFKYPRPPKPEAPRIYEAHVGMSGIEPRVTSYVEFAENVLPRIKANNYNTVQLMAVAEHSYYGSFGYHVTNFFAPSSRSGTPEDLKFLIDKAHSLGLQVLIDMVHSHASNNLTDGLNGYDIGQRTEESYFHTGERGYHKLWDSRLFNYGNWEVQRFLLSNLRWWLEEFQFDGFRFDGVTSMLYHHHGINVGFTGNYQEYFGKATDTEATAYLMLANSLIRNIYPDAIVIAEDVSGMPTLGRPVSEGGLGFDYRLAMAIPDKWIEYLKHKRDNQWSMKEIVGTLTNRRYTEKCVAYAESHDQAIVGDKTIAFSLMDKDMYSGMSCLQSPSPVVDRGIALHKMIHFITMALGGEGYLNFMGNEVIVFERGDIVFVFNFHPDNTYSGYKIGCDMAGKYRVALDSDALEFGGYGRVSHDVDHFTSPEGVPGKPETNFNKRPNSFKILVPPRTCLVYFKVPETTLIGDNTFSIVEKPVLA